MSDTILTITGSDGTGGSGVQSDIRLISEMGGRAVSVAVGHRDAEPVLGPRKPLEETVRFIK